MTVHTNHRSPYVGAGENGARRSAQIDREEADTLDWSDPRHDELITSAEAWENQARELMLQRLGPRPTLDQVRESIGNESMLAALALLDLSPTVARDVAQFTEWATASGRFTYDRDENGHADPDTGVFHPDAFIDWEAWADDYDSHGRSWSSTEHRLAQLVAALTVIDRAMKITGVLDSMGSWESDVWRILVEWGTGGNQKDLPGRERLA